MQRIVSNFKLYRDVGGCSTIFYCEVKCEDVTGTEGAEGSPGATEEPLKQIFQSSDREQHEAGPMTDEERGNPCDSTDILLVGVVTCSWNIIGICATLACEHGKTVDFRGR